MAKLSQGDIQNIIQNAETWFTDYVKEHPEDPVTKEKDDTLTNDQLFCQYNEDIEEGVAQMILGDRFVAGGTDYKLFTTRNRMYVTCNTKDGNELSFELDDNVDWSKNDVKPDYDKIEQSYTMAYPIKLTTILWGLLIVAAIFTCYIVTKVRG